MNPVMHNKWYVEPEPQEETESWLLTYLDMITLLLVLLVAMLTLSGQVPAASTANATSGLLPAHSGLFPGQAEMAAAPVALPPEALPRPVVRQPVPQSGEAVTDSVTQDGGALAIGRVHPDAFAMPVTPGDGSVDMMSDVPDYVLGAVDPDAILKHVMGPAVEPPDVTPPAMNVAALPELGDDIEIIRNKESISFRINSEILYSSAKADLSLEGLAVLRRLIPVFKDSDYAITVEGHTDSVPVRGGRYASNWELSGARAGSVVRYLEANGIGSSRLRAIGYADTRPLAGNDSDKGRAANRRVELILDQPKPPGRR